MFTDTIQITTSEKRINFASNFNPIGKDEYEKVVDTLIISDLHLGSDVSRSDAIFKLLTSIKFKRLILNGDIFDDLNFKRMKKNDWKLLSLLRKLASKKTKRELIWVVGNHDGAADVLSHLLGIKIYEEFVWESEGKVFMAIHGHQFDKFILENVVLTEIVSYIYLLIQKFDTENQYFSRWIKMKSKKWLRLSQKIAIDAIQYAKTRGVDVVFCGHTHIAGYYSDGITEYYNSGCWTDIPSQFITICPKSGIKINGLSKFFSLN